jgi:mycothiol synthase
MVTPNIPSQITVPDAPAISGLTFRRFRGKSDYPLMVTILDACNAADGLEYINTVDEIVWVFAHLTNCDPEWDMLFAEIHDQTVAFSRVWWIEESGGERFYISLGFVHPTCRRQGLGAAMLRYNECRLRQIARMHPAGSDRFFRVWATDTEYGAQALFTRSGYRPVRYYVEMIRPIASPLSDVPMPEGLEMRPVEPGQIPLIWRAMQEARQDHWGYVPPAKHDYERWTAGRLFAPHLWKVAWAPGPKGKPGPGCRHGPESPR